MKAENLQCREQIDAASYNEGFKDGRIEGAQIAATAYVNASNSMPIVITDSVSIARLQKEQRLIEIGRATEKAFEELGSPRITGYAPDDLVGLKSIEELLQWAKEREQG